MTADTKQLLAKLDSAITEVRAAVNAVEPLRELVRLHEIAQHPERYAEFVGTELQPMFLYSVPADDHRADCARRLALMYLAGFYRAHFKGLSPASLRLAAALAVAKPEVVVHFELKLADEEAVTMTGRKGS